MSAPKTTNAWGFLGKVESAYGTDSVPVAGTDGILLAEKPDIDPSQYLHDGSRGITPGGAPRIRVAQSGRFRTMKVSAEMIGAGAAYSASVFPSLHTLLRICGLEPTGSFGGGSEKWSYGSEVGPSGLDSGSIYAYLAGQLYKSLGTYGSFEISVDGPGVPRFDFDLAGIGVLESDASIPSISSYPSVSNLPPKAETIGLALGTFTAGIVRGFRFTQNRNFDNPRANINTSGHGGFTPGGRNPTLEVTLEKCTTLETSPPYHTATTFNPYQLKETGTQLIANMTIGSVQYKRWRLWSGPAGGATASAQVTNVEESEDGPTSLWVVTLEFKPSSYIANDEFSLVTD